MVIGYCFWLNSGGYNITYHLLECYAFNAQSGLLVMVPDYHGWKIKCIKKNFAVTTHGGCGHCKLAIFGRIG